MKLSFVTRLQIIHYSSVKKCKQIKTTGLREYQSNDDEKVSHLPLLALERIFFDLACKTRIETNRQWLKKQQSVRPAMFCRRNQENLESAFYEDNYVKKNESLIKVCEECLSVVAKVVPSLHKSRSPAQQSNSIRENFQVFKSLLRKILIHLFHEFPEGIKLSYRMFHEKRFSLLPTLSRIDRQRGLKCVKKEPFP